MILVRVRYSLSRDRLRDSDAGLREPGPPMPLLPPPRGSAFTGIVTEGYDKYGSTDEGQYHPQTAEPLCVSLQRAGTRRSSRSVSDVDDFHQLRRSESLQLEARCGGWEEKGEERARRQMFTITHTQKVGIFSSRGTRNKPLDFSATAPAKSPFLKSQNAKKKGQKPKKKKKKRKTHHPSVNQLCTIVTLSCSPLQALQLLRSER